MERKWWHDKVAYQIYPKSFKDSNGDGIGDIRGIIEKLDYLKELGVDIIWLSPVYQSPLADQGYDISDYYKIDPRYGTMEDMEELIAAMKERQMYLLMDLVVNHCSDEHEWFQNAIKDPEGEYGNYFYLKRPGEELTGNYRSYFGGSVWEPLPGNPGWHYFHAFHKKQPDLNWENPKVRQEIYKNINWWLEKGLAGFRIDAIINIKKELPFCNHPADREDGLCCIQRMIEGAKGVGVFLTELRDETFRKYDAFTVGEVFDEKEEEIPDFIGEDGYFSSMFDFNETICNGSDKGWYANRPITAQDYKNCCFTAQSHVKDVGFFSNIIENHDEPRGVSRYLPEGETSVEAKKMLGGVNFLMRGLPFIFQGQEIGMENQKFTDISQIDDISTLDQYQVARDAGLSEKEALDVVAKYSRDNARTPMQWSACGHGGFTTGTPWLAVNENYREINVEAQKADENSVLSFYKELIALRKHPEYKEALVYGSLVPYRREQKNLMAYERIGEDKTLLVLANYQKERQSVPLNGKKYEVLLSNTAEWKKGEPVEGELDMSGFQLLVLRECEK